MRNITYKIKIKIFIARNYRTSIRNNMIDYMSIIRLYSYLPIGI